MIAFAAVRRRSVSPLTCRLEKRRTSADGRERRQLQPQLQPRHRSDVRRSPWCRRSRRLAVSLMGCIRSSCSSIRMSEPPVGEHSVSRVRPLRPSLQTCPRWLVRSSGWPVGWRASSTDPLSRHAFCSKGRMQLVADHEGVCARCCSSETTGPRPITTSSSSTSRADGWPVGDYRWGGRGATPPRGSRPPIPTASPATGRPSPTCATCRAARGMRLIVRRNARTPARS
jgi:hypothetical protein